VASEKRLAVLITANAKQAQQEFGKLGSAAEKSGGRTTRALSGMQKGLVGLGVGAAALGSFKAFEESEKIARQTDAVIKSTGGSAQVTSKHISDLASEMSKLAGIDDEMIQSGENMLLTFTNIRNEAGKGNDVFDQAAKTALDMSVAMGTDMTSSAVQLGKALNDPIKGVSALSKVGVTFTDGQKKMIQSLVESGDLMGAQKVILAELAKEFGGSAEAQATASGKAQVAIENMGESVGAVLAPALERGASLVAGLASAFSSMPEGAQTAIVGIAGVGAAAVVAGPRIASMYSSVASGVSSLRTFASSMNEAISSIAATRGVSKGTAAFEALKSSVVAINPAMVAGAAATAGLVYALADVQMTAQRAKENVSDLQRQIDAGATPAEAAIKKLANTIAGVDGGFSDLGGSSAEFRKDLEDLGVSASDAGKLITGSEERFKSWSKALRDANPDGSSERLIANLDRMREATDKASQSKEIEAKVTKELGVKTDETASATVRATKATRDHWAADGQLVRSFQQRVLEQNKINDGLQRAIDLAYSSVDAELALKSAHDSVQDAQLALAQARKEGNPEQIQRAEDSLTSAIMREAQASVEAARSSAEAQGKSLSASEAAGIQRAKLAELATQTGFTSNELKWLSAQLDNAARQRDVQINTAQAIDNIDRLIQKIRDLAAVGSVVGAAGSTIDVGVAGALAGLSARNGAVTAYAKGGITPAHITRDQLFKYGEPATGGEAFVPRKGDKKRSTAILGEAAGWYGMQVVPMAKGGLNRSWGEAGVKVGTVFEDGSVVTAADMERYRRSQRQTATFGSASTTVNPGRPPAVFGSSTGAGITINVFEAKDARNTARQVVAEINRATRMGQSPLVGSRR